MERGELQIQLVCGAYNFKQGKIVLGHRKGWVESPFLLHYSIPAMKCIIWIIFHSVVYIR